MNNFDIQGHRGARGLLPENSIPAFQLALDLGVRTLEMDIVISRDQQVVLSHDPFFSPEICLQPDGKAIPKDSEDKFRLYDLTYDEIRAYDCGSIGNPRFPTQRATSVRKPLLHEVIQFSESYARRIERPSPHYNIETKSTPDGDNVRHPEPEQFVNLLLQVLQQHSVLDRTIIQSFDPRTLRIVHSNWPDVRTALLIAAEFDEGVSGNVASLGFTPSIYSPDESLVTQALVDQCHSAGMQVLPWTVNDVDRMQELFDVGVDGLITDYPDRAVDLLPEFHRR